ncbi:UNVERIFIED_CONTAM: zinc finger protein [Trichonephila clavipes]
MPTKSLTFVKSEKRLSLDVLDALRAHANKKPYVCEVCAKRHSSTSFTLCNNETPFVCEICYKSNLRVHLRVHTTEKPHICEICKKVFCKKSSLSLHLRTHAS